MSEPKPRGIAYNHEVIDPIEVCTGGPEPWDSMKMNDCSDCHAKNGVRDHCLMCHK